MNWLIRHFIKRVINCERGGGGGDDAPQAKEVDPLEQARAQYNAQLELYPKAQALQYQQTTDPNTGVLPLTQFYEDVRQQVFPQETQVRNQLVSNILNQLISPTGLTPEQQTAQQGLRDTAVSDAQRSQRTRANLGGNLYGGRSQAAEQKDINNLQYQFAESDINREQTNRNNNSQLALAILQMLYPNSGIQQPTFTSPVASADTTYQGAVSQANTNAQLAAQQQQNDAMLQSALWQELGGAAGGWMGGDAFNNFLT